jgi:hypothetical protein
MSAEEPPGGHRDAVAAQARAIASAWSPPGAPDSWWLTAAMFTAIAEDDVLLDLASDVPMDRLPPLLFSAAVRFLVAEHEPSPLAGYFPRPGGEQPGWDDRFLPTLRAFCHDHRDALAGLCATHRYQMTEVARCMDVLPALATFAEADSRPLALVDLGAGAGLGLHLDRYRYVYQLPNDAELSVGDAASEVQLCCAVRPGACPPIPARLPAVSHRVGVDTEPHDLNDPGTAAWLAACVPPEIGAVTRFAAAASVAKSDPAPLVRGNLLDVLPGVVERLPSEALVCLTDTYVHVFLTPEQLAHFHQLIDQIGRERDLEWISVDPLVPLGPQGTAAVQGTDVPDEWIRDNREGGVFGVIGRVSVRDGVRTGCLLGRAHPSAAWLEWTAPTREALIRSSRTQHRIGPR